MENIFDLELTDSEIRAKEYIIRTLKEANLKPCDPRSGDIAKAKLPPWYDDGKHRRGQKYFSDNRYGVLQSQLCGLIVLLAEPIGLNILSSTGRSSTAETARRRYVSTIFQVLSWYESDLSHGSKSWISLHQVRKMHFNASKHKDIGFITQAEVAFTTFGFMGFALVRPHLFAIKHDNVEDQEAFIHFWAVIGHVLGVEDQYNMCLHSVGTVSIICQILLRYVFMPLIQIETPDFKRMVTAMLDGLSTVLPHLSYDVQMFHVKRVIGVPGYQYDMDVMEAGMGRQIFSKIELVEIRKHCFKHIGYETAQIIFNEYILLLSIKFHSLDKMDQNGVHIATDKTDSEFSTALHKLLELKSPHQVVVRKLKDTDWMNYFSDSKLHDLSICDQLIVKCYWKLMKFCEYRIGKYLIECGMTGILFIVRKYHETGKDHKYYN